APPVGRTSGCVGEHGRGPSSAASGAVTPTRRSRLGLGNCLLALNRVRLPPGEGGRNAGEAEHGAGRRTSSSRERLRGCPFVAEGDGGCAEFEFEFEFDAEHLRVGSWREGGEGASALGCRRAVVPERGAGLFGGGAGAAAAGPLPSDGAAGPGAALVRLLQCDGPEGEPGLAGGFRCADRLSPGNVGTGAGEAGGGGDAAAGGAAARARRGAGGHRVAGGRVRAAGP